MPTISVIVPVYNVEPYLRRCADSILNQTFRDFELILVDDGSPDNCGAICDEYAAQDSRVRVIHQANGGLSAARNAGIDWAFENSDSRWLSFIDSDDWVHPQILEALLDAVIRTKIPVSIAPFKRISTELETDSFGWNPDRTEIWNTEKFFCQKNVEATIACAKLYSKELFRELRYPAGKIHEDEFLTYRVIFQTERVAYIPVPMYWYFQNTSGITHEKWNTRKLDKVQAFREQLNWFEKNGFEQAYRTRITSYAWIIGENLRHLSESEIPEKGKHIRQLRKTLRTFIREKRTILSPDDITTKWIFQIAYPKEMSIRRFIRHKARVLHTLGLNGIVRCLTRK